MTQHQLEFPAIAGDRISRQAAAFHESNRHVFAWLKFYALQLREAGVKRWGIAGLFEKLRYEHAVKTKGDEFKLNNNYRAWYARKLMAEVPELDGFFLTRSSESDERG